MVTFPKAVVLASPWVDLTCSSNSYRENKPFDIVPFKLSNLHEPITEAFEHPVHSYCFGKGDQEVHVLTPRVTSMGQLPLRRVGTIGSNLDKDTMERFVRHPLVSPIFASFANIPHLLIQAGDAEVLRDESIALAYKCHQDNPACVVRHELYADMVYTV